MLAGVERFYYGPRSKSEHNAQNSLKKKPGNVLRGAGNEAECTSVHFAGRKHFDWAIGKANARSERVGGCGDVYKGILREASSPALTSLTVVAVGKSCQRVAVRWATVVACKIRRNGAPNPLVETQGGEEEELTGRGWTSSGGAVAGGSGSSLVFYCCVGLLFVSPL